METPPAVKDFDLKANHALQMAQDMIVDSPQKFEDGNKFLSFLRQCEKEANETFDPIIKAAREAKAKHYKPIEEAYGLAKNKLRIYADAEESKRLTIEREANEKARKEAEDKRLAEAVLSEKDGRISDAEHLINTPAVATPVVIPRETKIDGRVFRKTYGASVSDLAALVLAVAESIKSKDGRYPLAYLEGNAATLNAAARSQKEEMRIPGVRLVIR